MTKPADKGDLPSLESARDKAAAEAQAAVADVAEARAKAAGDIDDGRESAAAAIEEAVAAQADVDRKEQKIRAGFTTEDLTASTGPRGVVGDAVGGPMAERRPRKGSAREERARNR